MTRFSDLPIKQKLMVIIIVTTSAALLIAGLGIVITDSLLFKEYLEGDLDTFARVIAENSTAALTFDDPKSARELLSALRARPHIVAACLYQLTGPPFSDYVRMGDNYQCSATRESEGIHTTGQLLIATRAVTLGGRRIGTLEIVYDLREISDRVKLFGAMVLLVLIVSTLLVVLLSSNLRTMFVAPILQLAGTATRVTATRNYGVRAAPLMNDEVGTLATAFNEMLTGIESRDQELVRTLGEREAALQRLAKLNEDLQRSNDELARSNQDLERFAFIASHDMQEPLRMVTIYSQLLMKVCDDSGPEAATYRDRIVAGTVRMRNLLSDLLAYVEVTTTPGQTEFVDLNSVIEKVKDDLNASIGDTGAQVTSGTLPVIRIHPGHAVSILQNLIGNAIKYRSEAAPAIHISAQEDGRWVRLSVADNGIGIAPEYHDSIFLAFTRLHGRDIPGTGIGLAICQRIVERYGGQIKVESDVGKGARFVITFPRAALKHDLHEPDAQGATSSHSSS